MHIRATLHQQFRMVNNSPWQGYMFNRPHSSDPPDALAGVSLDRWLAGRVIGGCGFCAGSARQWLSPFFVANGEFPHAVPGGEQFPDEVDFCKKRRMQLFDLPDRK
ncbi:MAG: hypothetical protein HGA56_08375 [Chlorobiaceae bacterium]|nr:hypothetical protein [Chlorobiaceae bacterium]